MDLDFLHFYDIMEYRKGGKMINISEEEREDLYILFNYYLLFKRSNAVDPYARTKESAIEQIRKGIEAVISLRNKDHYDKAWREFARNEDFDYLFEQGLLGR